MKQNFLASLNNSERQKYNSKKTNGFSNDYLGIELRIAINWMFLSQNSIRLVICYYYVLCCQNFGFSKFFLRVLCRQLLRLCHDDVFVFVFLCIVHLKNLSYICENTNLTSRCSSWLLRHSKSHFSFFTNWKKRKKSFI